VEATGCHFLHRFPAGYPGIARVRPPPCSCCSLYDTEAEKPPETAQHFGCHAVPLRPNLADPRGSAANVGPESRSATSVKCYLREDGPVRRKTWNLDSCFEDDALGWLRANALGRGSRCRKAVSRQYPQWVGLSKSDLVSMRDRQDGGATRSSRQRLQKSGVRRFATDGRMVATPAGDVTVGQVRSVTCTA
jgi:hypothetical protein